MRPPPPHSSRLVSHRGSLLSAILLQSALGACAEPVEESAPVNLVLIVVDTLRADAVLDPQELVATPHLDAFGEDAVVFPRAFTSAPMTLPAHTTLFSSRDPHRTGVTRNGQVVPSDLPLLAEHLRNRGYHTRAQISIGTLNPAFGEQASLARGFDEYVCKPSPTIAGDLINQELLPGLDELPGAQPFFLFAHYSDPHAPYDAHGTVVHTAEIFLDGKFQDEILTSETTFWKEQLLLAPGEHVLEVRSADPLCPRMVTCMHEGAPVEMEFLEGAPHRVSDGLRVRLHNEQAEEARFLVKLLISDVPSRVDRRERYRYEVEFVDGRIGELIEKLKVLGLYESSLVVFASDHGEGLGEHGVSGHIENLHDELTHVPFAIKLPSGHPGLPSLEANRSRLVGLIDFVPTALEILDLPPLPGQSGRSLLASVPDRLIVSETHRPEARRTSIALRGDDYKLIHFPEEERFELFDLRVDPHETRDLFAEEGSAFQAWRENLLRIAEAAEAAQTPLEVLDDETIARLKALGYFQDI